MSCVVLGCICGTIGQQQQQSTRHETCLSWPGDRHACAQPNGRSIDIETVGRGQTIRRRLDLLPALCAKIGIQTCHIHFFDIHLTNFCISLFCCVFVFMFLMYIIRLAATFIDTSLWNGGDDLLFHIFSDLYTDPDPTNYFELFSN